MHNNARDVQLLTSAQYSQRNITTVGYQDLFEHDYYSQLQALHQILLVERFAQKFSLLSLFWRGNWVHYLHCLDNKKGLALADAVSLSDKGGCVWFWSGVNGANHRRFNSAWMISRISLPLLRFAHFAGTEAAAAGQQAERQEPVRHH